MKANRKFMDEEAVSPVIGVILMVAITVILAAVIAAFVFELGGSLKKPYIVGAIAYQENANVRITYQGGPDSMSLYQINVTVADGEVNNTLFGSDTGTTAIDVGASAVISGATAGQDHVICVGRFADGTRQIILDTYV